MQIELFLFFNLGGFIVCFFFEFIDFYAYDVIIFIECYEIYSIIE